MPHPLAEQRMGERPARDRGSEFLLTADETHENCMAAMEPGLGPITAAYPP